jgi:hypothetical protein
MNPSVVNTRIAQFLEAPHVGVPPRCSQTCDNAAEARVVDKDTELSLQVVNSESLSSARNAHIDTLRRPIGLTNWRLPARSRLHLVLLIDCRPLCPGNGARILAALVQPCPHQARNIASPYHHVIHLFPLWGIQSRFKQLRRPLQARLMHSEQLPLMQKASASEIIPHLTNLGPRGCLGRKCCGQCDLLGLTHAEPRCLDTKGRLGQRHSIAAWEEPLECPRLHGIKRLQCAPLLPEFLTAGPEQVRHFRNAKTSTRKHML